MSEQMASARTDIPNKKSRVEDNYTTATSNDVKYSD